MEPGDIVEDFEALDQEGRSVRLSELVADGPVVLFFYPKAMTSGCTAESCHFRDLRGELARFGAQAVGISADSPDRQAEFDQSHGLGMTLLSDPDRAVAKSMGVGSMGPSRRKTFVIDRDRRIGEVISSVTDMHVHADRALEVLAEL